MNKIALTLILLLSASIAFASPRVGTRPEGICTRDLNLWGQASRCTCDQGQIYDQRAGLCLEDVKGEEIIVQGAVAAAMAAIGGETTGFEITTPEAHTYELILKVPDQEKLRKLDGMWFEVTGELIIIDSVERKGRKAIIANTLAVLE